MGKTASGKEKKSRAPLKAGRKAQSAKAATRNAKAGKKSARKQRRTARVPEIQRILAANLRTYRKQAKLTQLELAERAGLNGKHVGGIERAEENVTIATLEKLAGVLHIPLHRLLTPPSQ